MSDSTDKIHKPGLENNNNSSIDEKSKCNDDNQLSSTTNNKYSVQKNFENDHEILGVASCRKATKDAKKNTFDNKIEIKNEIQSLHEELQLAQHGISRSGQFQRKIPRSQAKERSQKRKIIEQEEQLTAEKLEFKNNPNIINSKNNEKRLRLRGSMAALADGRILHDSLLFDDSMKLQKSDLTDGTDSDDNSDDNGVLKSSEVEKIRDTNVLQSNEAVDSDEPENDLESDAEDEFDESDEEVEIEGAENGKSDQSSPTILDDTEDPKRRKKSRLHSRRYQYRLRNFKSQRLAEKHGAALGAHALGRPLEAIQQLKQVAREAPSAPQVYSSLGLVYEDMLRQSQRRRLQLGDEANGSSNRTTKNGKSNSLISSKRKDYKTDVNIPDSNLDEQLDLAKKAYGAYHVAAILYKRDYSLWVRAADSASEVAAIHASIMELTTIPDTVREYHRAERRRWFEEAKNDYTTADNLHPPGIDIPAKLAFVQMELGMYADALTLLTDLKIFPDFRSSYKAWLLYSDLMLRIGYECSQFNKGNSNADNYMFRRWLRKLSRTFDWKERRLQALSKAFEAACGTKICSKYIQWLKSRIIAKNSNEKMNEEENRDYEEQRWHTGGTDGNTTGLDDTGEVKPNLDNKRRCDSDYQGGDEEKTKSGHTNLKDSLLETEKRLLEHRNKLELASFDATTRELDLKPDSLAAAERNSSRQVLLQNQDISMNKLEQEFKDTANSPANVESEEKNANFDTNDSSESWEENFLMSASCKTVCSIASELLRQILGMNMSSTDGNVFVGGSLICDAVSHYFRERFNVIQERKKRRIENDALKAISEFALRSKDYDDANDAIDRQGTRSGYQSEDFLSDDDDLLSNEQPEFLQSLERGTLPPEILVMYGLCLMGTGGKDYLACKCISQIEQIYQEKRHFWTSGYVVVDTSVIVDNNWMNYRQSMTEPLGRTALFAFVADVIHRSGRENEFSRWISELYRNHITKLSRANIVDDVLNLNDEKNAPIVHRHNILFRVLVAAARFEVYTIEGILSDSCNKGGISDAKKFVNVVQKLTELFGFIWKVDRTARVSTSCIETLEASSRAFSLLPTFSEQIINKNGENFLSEIIWKISTTIAMMCEESLSLPLTSEGEKDVEGLDSFPLQSSWMSPELQRLAIRSFNLCVATNVSLFSGWEKDEFNVRLMRHGNVPNFINISMSDVKVTGCLSVEYENSLSSQWKLIKNLLPLSITFDFDQQLDIVRESEDYKESIERLKTAKSKHKISCYGEEEGLAMLLSFSHACLILATKLKHQNHVNHLLCIALSIIIPASEFSLGVVIWDSSIGNSAISSQTNFDDWRNFDWDKDNIAPSNRQGYVRPRQRIVPPDGSKSLHQWFDGENEDYPLVNLISLPISLLQEEWRKVFRDTIEFDGADGVEAMVKLDLRVKQLRSCYSEHAVEVACLHVAAALIDVTAARDCQNRFLCIHQASLFASQAPKGGSSDHSFKSKLPSTETCTAHNALLTIGRAECLLATQFVPESAFLCSYVASVCSLHRDRQKSDFEWNTSWRIISILAYDLSVVIRNSANLILEEERYEDTSGTWEKHVIDELIRARIDGITWKQSLGIKNTSYDQKSVRKPTMVRKSELISSDSVDNLQAEDLRDDPLDNPSFQGDGIRSFTANERSLEQTSNEILETSSQSSVEDVDLVEV